jgi:glycosyltransferase involved in cell wall biosynthesis
MAPLASVIVRSYRRAEPLLELVDRLRRQRHASFEIIVVEQSDDPGLLARLDALGDPRLRVLPRPPLGAPGARNEGVRHARGELLLFVDDDDLPVTDTWIADHVANYDDPLCLGVNGRLSSQDALPGPPRFPRLVRWMSFSYSIFRDPLTLPVGSLRKAGITFAVGNNFSVRRALVDRVGGWDEGIPMGEEQSFFFRYERARQPGEYLVYDPQPVVWRRVDIVGGLDRRTRADWYENELKGRIIYYHHVVAHYFPWRFRLLYPLFVLRAAERVLFWIWDADNRAHGVLGRVAASVRVLGALPRMTLEWGWRSDRAAVRRVPALP